MKNLKSIALTAILSGATFLSFSQEKEIKTPEQRAEKRTEVLTKKLDLTTEQQLKVAELNQSTIKEVESIKNNSSLSKEEKKKAIKQLRETRRTELRSMLTTDQQQKMDKMKEKRDQKREKHERKRDK